MGFDFDQLYPGRFVKAGEFLGRDVTMKIAKVELEELEGDNGKEVKVIVTFEKAKKQLVLNKTNGTCVKAMFGRKTDDWIGKRVTFFPANESFGDTDVCIRVRGSPDIDGPIQIDTKIGRRKLKATMQKTGPAAKPSTAPGGASNGKGSGAPAPSVSPPAPSEPEPGPDADPLGDLGPGADG